MNSHQHLQILASTLIHKAAHLSITTQQEFIKDLAIKTSLTEEETNSILAAYNTFYTTKNPPSFPHVISIEELCEAYAKYNEDLLFEHINLTYRDLILSKGTPSLLNNIFYTAYFDIYSSPAPYVCRIISCAVFPKKANSISLFHHSIDANITRLFETFYKLNKDKYQWEFWNRQTKPDTYKDQRIIAFILFSSYLQNQFDLYVNRTYFQALKTRLIPSRLNKPSFLLEFLRNQIILERENHEAELSTWKNNYVVGAPSNCIRTGGIPVRVDEEDEDYMRMKRALVAVPKTRTSGPNS